MPAVAAAAAPPTIVNGAPTEIRNREATLHFSIDPEGLETTYYAEYGTTTSYGSRSWLYEWDLPAGDDPVALSEPLSVWGLSPGTTYHYRIVAFNEAGTTYGDDQEVTTTNGTLPTVVTGAPSNETTTSVVFHGTVDPEGEPLTACRFHYVTEDEFNRFGFQYSFGPTPTPMGNFVPCAETPAEIGEGDEPVPVHAALSGYSIRLYQVRLEAENAYDEGTPGAASAFGTPPPQVAYLGSTPRNKEATVQFTIDPNGLETEYEVEYGPEEGVYNEMNYFWNGTVPAGDEPVTREATFPAYWEGSLTPGTTYHWRVVARNDAGIDEGPDETFTTTNGIGAVFWTRPIADGTTENVHFEGTADPGGSLLTGCRFRWVTDSVFKNAGFEKWAAWHMERFGETVPCAQSFAEIGTGFAPEQVDADVAGIEPGIYHVRLEGENAYLDSTSVGEAFEVVVPETPGEVGKGCEQDPGCGPPETKPPLVTPPQGPAHAKKKHKKHRKNHRHRAHHNVRISVRS